MFIIQFLECKASKPFHYQKGGEGFIFLWRRTNIKSFMRRTALFFFLLFFIISGAQAQQKSKLFAVVVGISEYQQSGNNLTYSHKDAIEMYNLLKLQTKASNIRLLTNRQATKDNIIAAADSLFSKANPEDIVIFFFSGHGNPGKFQAHDKALPFTALEKVFKKTKAQRKIIFADACYAGTFRKSPQSPAASANTDAGKNVLLFLSSRSNQASEESKKIKNGAFTYFLIAGLKGGADANKDRYITAKELFTFVNPKVKEYTKGEQVPVMWGKFDDNMIIFNWKKN
jgi:uncharacterized caspase-like protein